MTAQTGQTIPAITVLAAQIPDLQPPLSVLIGRFREVVGRAEKDQPDVSPAKRSAQFWVIAIFTDALVRIRLFAEQNFNSIEPMGLLAVTRYVFELTIWLRRLNSDPRYGLVYYRMLLAKQLDYHTDLQTQLEREVGFLQSIEDQERELWKREGERVKQLADGAEQARAASEMSDRITREIDWLAARNFSLYADNARVNGYSFQAHLIQAKVLPRVAESIRDLQRELNSVDRDLPDEVRSLVPRGRDWRWRDEARAVGMECEYDFIYTYTSRLLHATPSSLTTDQKNLEPQEIQMFMRYVYVRMRDAMDMARDLLPSGLTTH